MTRVRDFVVVAVLLFSSACNSIAFSNGVEMPDVEVSKSELNTRIKISAPESINSFRTRDSITFVVEVVYKSEIQFSYDFGARIFILENNKWVEVNNITTYPEGAIVLSPRQGKPYDSSNTGMFSVYPNLPDRNIGYKMKVYVFGKIYSNGGTKHEIAAAVIDIQLTP